MFVNSSDVLIVVDMQNDFMPDGALAVTNGDAIIPVVNSLMEKFDNVVLTQDWHPYKHVSFASSWEGAKPLDVIDVSYGDQVLWPDHCIAGKPGSDFHPNLYTTKAFVILRKGTHKDVDSYSAFEEANGYDTGLMGLLLRRGISRLFVCGLATDYCVKSTAEHATVGFMTYVIYDACRAVNRNFDSVAWANEKDVNLISAVDILYPKESVGKLNA